MNEQREVIYGERRKVLSGENIKEQIFSMVENVIQAQVDLIIPDEEYPEEWNLITLNEELGKFRLEPFLLTDQEKETISKPDFVKRIQEVAVEYYKKKETDIGEERIRELERVILLKVVDQKWMDHLDNIDQMRQGINLRAYGQRDPIVEYKNISYDMFEELNYNIQTDTIRSLFNLRVETQMEREQVSKPISTNKDSGVQAKKQPKRVQKVERNDICSCGSGKKYKQCCGQGK